VSLIAFCKQYKINFTRGACISFGSTRPPHWVNINGLHFWNVVGPEAFTVDDNEIILGYQSCQVVESDRHFRNHLCKHNLTFSGWSTHICALKGTVEVAEVHIFVRWKVRLKWPKYTYLCTERYGWSGQSTHICAAGHLNATSGSALRGTDRAAAGI
jgi:hypothetical protein